MYILFDDMGYGEPPCFRAKSEFKLPTLDRLAKEGMRFTDAHSPSAVCTPTHYGLLTGRYRSRSLGPVEQPDDLPVGLLAGVRQVLYRRSISSAGR